MIKSSAEAAFPERCMVVGQSRPVLAGQGILSVNAAPLQERSFAMKRLAIRIVVLCMLLVPAARAAELHVVSSGSFAAAYKTLAPVFEQKTGDRLVTEWGPSMGDTPQAVPARLKRGERIDVVIMVGYALGDLVRQGKVVDDSRVDLARSGIGVVVRHGAPHP